MRIGWIGLGRMGFPMAQRLLRAGHPMRVWNRTRSKAEPLVGDGAVLVERTAELRDSDFLFTMLATGKDVKEVFFGKDGVAVDGAGPAPRIIVDCSSIGFDESGEIRERLAARGVQFLSAPVSGNPKCVVAGKLSSVVSGPKACFDAAEPLIKTYAARGVAYVGAGELARICKIAHNVFLSAVIENLIEVTLLAQKAGVPRHAFLKFMNDSAMGSIFTQYKAPTLVNLDFKPTFTMGLLRKDVDLGLETARRLGVHMPVTATVREVLQSHFGLATQQPDPEAYLAKDFAVLIETMALHSGIQLESENVAVPSGLEV
jgi:3-hydroxyisobutyrate dehydrogenase